MSELIWWVLALVAVVLAIEFFYLRGENLAQFDSPKPAPKSSGPIASDEHNAVVASLGGISAQEYIGSDTF